VQPTPWECVRGIDRSFGHNRLSDDAHFLSRAELLWSLTDITAKGGNLLLNVGPRGEDATIADAQRHRLDWLAAFTAASGDALFATRPWVCPQGVAAGGVEIRYTARDTTVFAFLRLGAGEDGTPGVAPSVTLHEVLATPTTEVASLEGRPLAFETTPTGLVVHLAAPLSPDRPVAIALGHVEAR
jgi:alpha-L-fucosidase